MNDGQIQGYASRDDIPQGEAALGMFLAAIGVCLLCYMVLLCFLPQTKRVSEKQLQ